MVKEILVTSRQMKRRRKFLHFLIILFFSLALVAAVIGIFYYHKWRVNDVRVSGAETLKNNDVADFVRRSMEHKIFYVLPGDNFTLVNTTALAASLRRSLPAIKELSLDRVWPNRLDVTIKERKSWGVYCAGACFLLDEEGTIYAPAPAFEGNLIIKVIDERTGVVVNLGDKLNLAKSAKEIYDKLSVAAGERLLGLIIKTDTEWQVQSLSGWRILIDSATDLNLAVKNLEVVLQEVGDRRAQLDYIDLRYGRKIFYKFK